MKWWERAIVVAIIATFTFLVGACEYAKWRECRRYHPLWYCLERGGR